MRFFLSIIFLFFVNKNPLPPKIDSKYYGLVSEQHHVKKCVYIFILIHRLAFMNQNFPIEGAQFFMATIIKGRQSNAHAQAGLLQLVETYFLIF